MADNRRKKDALTTNIKTRRLLPLDDDEAVTVAGCV
jgi:hypothetical protein